VDDLGIICMILRLAILKQYQSVTDTHRQTDTPWQPRLA